MILTTNRYQELDSAAKTRFSQHLHIPYPLDEEQIGKLVDSIAAELHYILEDNAIREDLIKFFYNPMIGGEAALRIVNLYETSVGREKINENLFSPQRHLPSYVATGRLPSRESRTL